RHCPRFGDAYFVGGVRSVFGDVGIRSALAGRRRGHSQTIERFLRGREDVARLVEGPIVSFGLVARLAQAEAEAMAVVLDANDLDGNDIALVDDFTRVVYAAVDELRDGDEGFGGPLQADEGGG